MAVMTLRDVLEQKEVADSPENHTSGSPGIEEHLIRKALLSSMSSLRSYS